MASKVKVVWKSDGYIELMKSAEIQSELTKQAVAYRDSLGDGYEIEPAYIGVTRANVAIAGRRVGTATDEAYNDNYDNNTMLKALGGKA